MCSELPTYKHGDHKLIDTRKQKSHRAEVIENLSQ